MANEERIEIRKNAAPVGQQQWFWHWKAANNKIIATSGEPFHSKHDAYDAADKINNKLADPVSIKIIED